MFYVESVCVCVRVYKDEKGAMEHQDNLSEI